jgi:hypothetical protein
MSIESDLFAALSHSASQTAALIVDPTVTDPVSGNPIVRFYPASQVPQESGMPAIAYSRVSNAVASRSQDGTKLMKPRYQFDCRDKTYVGAQALEDALIADLEYHHFGSVKQVHHDGGGPDERDAETELYTRRVELVIWR